MANYRQVKLSFWTDHLVSDNFSAEDKYFFLYLLTNIHTNLCGCYEVSVKQIALDMGYSPDSIVSIIDRFEKKYGLIRYDKETYELLILNWSKHNWTDSPKFRKLVKQEIEKLKNPQFREYLSAIFDGEDTEKYRISTPDTVSGTPDTSLFCTVIDNSNSNYSNSSNSINDINIKEVNTEKEVKKRARKKYEDTPEFTEFWNAYPKQKDKTKAREEFARVDVPLDVLLSALEIQKQSHDWTKEGGQYIPYPAKWLKGRRWEDSMEVNVQSGGRYDNLKRIAEEFDDD